jgi:hypothetical protein
MRPLVAALPLFFALACAPIQTVALSKERLPPGSQVTVHVLGFDGAGLEHVISETLMKAGFDVRSSAAVSMVATRATYPEGGENTDLLKRYQTPYACRVKAAGRGQYIEFFTLQLIHVETGKILLSMRGGDGTNSYSAEEVAKTLREHLVP